MQTFRRCAAFCLISLVLLLACKKSDQSTPLVNQPPVVNAGPDQLILLPKNSTQLVGSAVDRDGSIISYQWETSMKQSGPHTVVTPTEPVTDLTDLGLGEYRFSLKVNDNKGRLATDEVLVLVGDSASYPWNY